MRLRRLFPALAGLGLLLALPVAAQNVQIQNLPPATTPPSSADLLIISQQGAARKLPWSSVSPSATISGDCAGTSLTSAVSIICTKTNGVAFGTAATDNTGTSGATIPLNNGGFTQSGAVTFGSNVTFSMLTSAGSQCLTVSSVGLLGTTSAPCIATNAQQTWSAIQSFNSNDLVLNGASSGSTTVNASSVASGTITFPAATGTVALLPVTLTNLATQAGGTVVANSTGSSASPTATANPVLGVQGTTPGSLTIDGGPTSTSGTLTLNGYTSGSIALTVPASGGNVTITLPDNPTNGYCITTNASGVWSYTSCSSAPALYAGSSAGTPTTPTVTAQQGNVAIGDGASVTSAGVGNIAIGTNAIVNTAGGGSSYSVAIGHGATVASNNTDAVALGNSIASGQDSFAVAIAGHSASIGATGAESIAMGEAAYASGQYSVSIGNGNTASNLAAIAFGNANTASGSQSMALGAANTSSGTHSTALGYQSFTTNYGQVAQASGERSAFGDSQVSRYTLRGTTTNASSTQIYLDGSSAQLAVTASQALSYSIKAVAHDRTTPANNLAITTLNNGLVYNNAGTLALVPPSYSAIVALNGWTTTSASASAAASGPNLIINVQGPSGTTDTIDWVVEVDTVEVTN